MTRLLMGIADRSRANSRTNDIRSKRRSILGTRNGAAMVNRRIGYRLGG